MVAWWCLQSVFKPIWQGGRSRQSLFKSGKRRAGNYRTDDFCNWLIREAAVSPSDRQFRSLDHRGQERISGLFLNNYPTLGGGGMAEDGLAVRWGHVFTVPGIWIARNLFHLTGPMARGAAGDNGDVSEEYARLLLSVVLGSVGAIAWTIAVRRRPSGEWTESALRILLRYSIALGLAGYAVAKLFPQQFPPFSAAVLERRVGDLTPMSLLWTFMQYLRAYAFKRSWWSAP
jgi:hypothetical protein